jgi:hypothetical protein
LSSKYNTATPKKLSTNHSAECTALWLNTIATAAPIVSSAVIMKKAISMILFSPQEQPSDDCTFYHNRRLSLTVVLDTKTQGREGRKEQL